MEGEDYRTGSADSENSSDNSYVQVSREDAQNMDPPDSEPGDDSPQLISGTGVSPEDDFAHQEGDSTKREQEPVQVSAGCKLVPTQENLQSFWYEVSSGG